MQDECTKQRFSFFIFTCLKVLHLFFQLLLTFTLLLNKHISCPNRLFLIGHVTLTDLLSPPLTPSCYSTKEIITSEENDTLYIPSPHITHNQKIKAHPSLPIFGRWKKNKPEAERESTWLPNFFSRGSNEICFLLFYFLTFLLLPPPIDCF